MKNPIENGERLWSGNMEGKKKSPVSNLTYEMSFFFFTLKKGKFDDTKD